MDAKYKLVVFDVNVVLTKNHTIIDIGELAGARDKVAGYIRQHTTGQMNLSNAVMEACKLLEGVTRRQVEEYSWGAPLMDGVKEMVKALTDNGVVLGMVTTGFKTTMNIINERLGNSFKYIVCNELVFDDKDKATGGVRFSVMENESKSDRLREMAESEGLLLHQCAAVGDSMGDVDMLDAAGLGIAFNPNKPLEEYATKHKMVVIKKKDLREIIPYVLGKT
jgi:phosphoserine phosphatase SerB